MTLFTEDLPWLQGADLDLVMGQAFCDLDRLANFWLVIRGAGVLPSRTHWLW